MRLLKLLKYLGLAVLLMLSGVAENWTVVGLLPGISVQSAAAQAVPGAVSANNDPCLFFAHQVAPVTCTSATTVSLIAPVNNQGIFVCGIQYQSSGAASTFEYGTGATCGSGTVAFTGPIQATSNINILSGATQWAVPAAATGNRLCVVCATSSVGVGHLTYVQAGP